MYAQIDKSEENIQKLSSNQILQNKRSDNSIFQFVDNRPEAIMQRKIQEMADNSPRVKQVIQLQEVTDNSTSMHTLPVQRKVSIRGEPIQSVVDYLIEHDLDILLSVEEAEAAGWMLGLSPTWDFNTPVDLLLYVNKVYSITNLIRSIFSTGILSRKKLEERNINYTGSEDKGSSGNLAVNILDSRSSDNEYTPKEISEQSMTATDRGSISVALEREDDWIKEDLVKESDIEFTDKEREIYCEEYKKQKDEYEQKEGKNFIDFEYFLNRYKREKAEKRNKQIMNTLFNPEMEDRAMDTIMAVVPQPKEGNEYGIYTERNTSYESSVESGKIPPGDGGFNYLLIPDWFRPFYLMIENLQPPNVTVKFVGTKIITAHYKTKNGHIPVTVNAPDYPSEVTPLLEKFKFLATHILTA